MTTTEMLTTARPGRFIPAPTVTRQMELVRFGLVASRITIARSVR